MGIACHLKAIDKISERYSISRGKQTISLKKHIELTTSRLEMVDLPSREIEIYDPIETSLRPNDLAQLHGLISRKHPSRHKFLEHLYEKYDVNKLTHRICVKDGEIERK